MDLLPVTAEWHPFLQIRVNIDQLHTAASHLVIFTTVGFRFPVKKARRLAAQSPPVSLVFAIAETCE